MKNRAVDSLGNIWVVDAGVEEGVKGNQIFKFNQQGDVLLTLGQPGIRGDGPNLFNESSDLAIAPTTVCKVRTGWRAQ